MVEKLKTLVSTGTPIDELYSSIIETIDYHLDYLNESLIENIADNFLSFYKQFLIINNPRPSHKGE